LTQHQPNRMHERTHAILVTPTTRNSFGNQDCICVIRIQKQPNKTHLALRPPCPCTSSTHHRSGSPSACALRLRPQATVHSSFLSAHRRRPGPGLLLDHPPPPSCPDHGTTTPNPSPTKPTRRLARARRASFSSLTHAVYVLQEN
jgi:hypothetical protein